MEVNKGLPAFGLRRKVQSKGLEQGTIGSDHRHRPKPFRPLCPPVDGVDTVDVDNAIAFVKIHIA